VAKAKFQAEFDFSAYYDQFDIPDDMQSCFVIRVKSATSPSGWKLYALKKMLMGVRFAVGTAQMATWVLTAPIAKWCSTMIDNVRIAAESEREFLHAVKTFLQRVDEAGITLNDRDSWNISDSEILARGAFNRENPFHFLGEEYEGATVKNAKKHLDKLGRAHELLTQSNGATTRRRFAALASLIGWMCNTRNIGTWRLFSLQRAYSRLVSPTATFMNDVLWDEPVQLEQTVMNDIAQAVGWLTNNEPVPLRELLPPGKSNRDYDVVVHVDASGNGWAAYVWFKATGKIYLVKAGWYDVMHHSAHAEPKAAKLTLRWVRSVAKENNWPCDNIAVITDHKALVTGQRQWYSGYRGFSSAYPLNDYFLELYGTDDTSLARRDVFHVDGTDNIADAESRNVSLRQPLSATLANVLFPDVSHYYHPFPQLPPRSYYQV
jgi:hypothetical protein